MSGSCRDNAIIIEFVQHITTTKITHPTSVFQIQYFCRIYRSTRLFDCSITKQLLLDYKKRHPFEIVSSFHLVSF